MIADVADDVAPIIVPPAWTLRPYQIEAIREIARAWQTRRACMIVLATGTGKTTIFSEVVRKRRDAGRGRALVLAHRIELVDQAADRIRLAGVTCDIESGDRLAPRIAMAGMSDCVVATVQTLRGRRLEGWHHGSFGTIVVDECFPAGTQVDGIPIERRRAGDMINAWNEITGKLERRMVMRAFRSVPNAMVRVYVEGRAIACTAGHPFATAHGWVRAGDLMSGDMVLSTIDDVRVQCVRNEVRAGDEVQARQGARGAPPLLGGVREGIASTLSERDDGADESGACLGAHDGAQPDVARRRAGEGVYDAPGNAVVASGARRERYGADGSATRACGGARVADGGGDQDGSAWGWAWSSDRLQTRHREHPSHGRNRGRRAVTRRARAEGAGRQEDRFPRLARVDRVEVLEPSSDGTFGGVCPDGTVYNLEVDGVHTYTVGGFGGVIVHNCHHSTAGTYRAIFDHFGDAKILGVTATPDRGDGVATGHIFGEEPAYVFGLREGIEAGYLAPIRALAVDTPSIDLSSVRVTKQEHGRDLSSEDLARAMRSQETLHEIAKPFVDLYEGRQSLIFVPSVEIAHALSAVIAGYIGAPLVNSLDGGSAKDERADVLARYKRGDIRVLINCALFTEGFDAPNTACVAIARPTRSRALYAQMLGRGTRIAPGKADCLILDFAPANERHELVAPIDLMEGNDLPEMDAAEARMKMDGSDVLRVLGDATAIATKRAAEKERDREKARLVAEAHYRARARDVFRDPLAMLGLPGQLGADRGPRATEKQIAALTSMGIPLPKSPSKREASKIFGELSRRKERGLCSIKQMRILGDKGLRTDVSRVEASAIMDALVAAKWRVTAEIKAQWGER